MQPSSQIIKILGSICRPKTYIALTYMGGDEKVTFRFEPPRDKTNKMSVRPAYAQFDQSLRCPHEESLDP